MNFSWAIPLFSQSRPISFLANPFFGLIEEPIFQSFCLILLLFISPYYHFCLPSFSGETTCDKQFCSKGFTVSYKKRKKLPSHSLLLFPPSTGEVICENCEGTGSSAFPPQLLALLTTTSFIYLKSDPSLPSTFFMDWTSFSSVTLI